MDAGNCGTHAAAGQPDIADTGKATAGDLRSFWGPLVTMKAGANAFRFVRAE